MTNSLELENRNGIATVWINRPDKHNTINLAVARDLASAMYALERDATVLSVVLRGRGKLFSAGGDITMFRDNLESIGTFMHEVIVPFHEATMTMRRMGKPVISAVHGSCAGGGLSLALAADFVIAEENTKFAIAYRKIGASTDGGMTHLLSRLLGQRKVMELLLLSDTFSAREAYEMGLINRCVTESEFDDAINTMATALAENAPKVVQNVKSLVYSAPTATYPEQLASEQSAFADVASTEDFQEGISAFFEQRKPSFTGR